MLSHWRYLAIAAGTGVCVGLVLTFLAESAFSPSSQNRRPDPRAAVALGVLETVLFAACWERLKTYWRRYRRTYRLANPPLIAADVLTICFGVAACVLLFVPEIRRPATQPPILGVISLCVGTLAASLLSARRSEPRPVSGKTVDPGSANYSDDPIDHDADDLLGRVPFVEGLHRQILRYPAANPFVFGLSAKWGEGKTSVLYLLRNRLEQDEETIVVYFNPWYWPNDKAILDGFYSALETAVARRFLIRGLHEILNRYRKLLTIGLRPWGLGFDMRIEAAPDELRAQLEAWIARIGRRVIVLIDDLDRLGESELLTTLRLTTLCTRVKNVIFLLSFDFDVVSKILHNNLGLDPAYLEKIIQQQIHVPPADQESIDRFLLFSDEDHRSAIDRLLDDLGLEGPHRREFDEKLTYFYKTQLVHVFRTLRRAKRYINGLRARLPAVANEVNFVDFVLLEALRTVSQRLGTVRGHR